MGRYGIAIIAAGAEQQRKGITMIKETIDWLEARKIELETVQAFGIEDYTKAGKTWLKFPYKLHGEVVNNKHRCITNKAFRQDSGATKCFWNQDVLDDKTLESEPLIITEGEMDTLALIQSGYVKTISIPDGAPAVRITGESEKYSYLDDLITKIRETSPFVILAVDSDKAGSNLLQDLSIRLGRDGCKWVRYPKECKDMNEVLIKYGEKGVKATVERAQWIKVDGVARMADIPPVPYARPYNVGVVGLDIKLRMGDFTVVSGIPSHGKSTWVNDICCRMAKNHQLNTCFASFEQNPQGDHKRNLRQWFIDRNESTWNDDEIASADDWIAQHYSFIYPTDYQVESEDISIGWLLEKCAVAVKRFGSNIVVIDPWNELDHIRPNGQSMTDYISIAIKRFKQFARVYNVHLIIVAHPTKMRMTQDGVRPKPTLYDIADSAAWYNKADLGIIIHRVTEDGSDYTLVSVQKSRYHNIIGKPCEIKMMFNTETAKYFCCET